MEDKIKTLKSYETPYVKVSLLSFASVLLTSATGTVEEMTVDEEYEW